VRRIAFTGSVATGRRVLAAGAQHIKHVTLELGGKNPLIVLPDADVEVAADAVVRGMNLTSTAGQSCMSTSRVLVHESIHDELVAACARRFAALRVGFPDDPATDVGPLAFRAHYERVVGHIERAVEQGARLVIGGQRPAGFERGYFLTPTLFDGVEPDMDLARKEVFGPVVAVLSWSDLDRAISVANATEYGLTANVVTADLGAALHAVDRLEAGLIWVNGPTPRPPGLPFGGVKHSGLGREHSLGDLLSYTEEVSVVVASPPSPVDGQ
jgi:betaine-aldehyde dehydrogenase